jgi:hypothetical protein
VQEEPNVIAGKKNIIIVKFFRRTTGKILIVEDIKVSNRRLRYEWIHAAILNCCELLIVRRGESGLKIWPPAWLCPENGSSAMGLGKGRAGHKPIPSARSAKRRHPFAPLADLRLWLANSSDGRIGHNSLPFHNFVKSFIDIGEKA